MVAKIKVVGHFDSVDRDEYEALVEMYEQWAWTLDESSEWDRAKCDMGEMTVDELATTFESWGEVLEADERRELEMLAVGEMTELERGRSCWYEVTAVA
jgi:hypothetical protein